MRYIVLGLIIALACITCDDGGDAPMVDAGGMVCPAAPDAAPAAPDAAPVSCDDDDTTAGERPTIEPDPHCPGAPHHGPCKSRPFWYWLAETEWCPDGDTWLIAATDLMDYPRACIPTKWAAPCPTKHTWFEAMRYLRETTFRCYRGWTR